MILGNGVGENWTGKLSGMCLYTQRQFGGGLGVWRWKSDLVLGNRLFMLLAVDSSTRCVCSPSGKRATAVDRARCSPGSTQEKDVTSRSNDLP